MSFNAISTSGSLLSDEFLSNALNPASAMDAFDPGTFTPEWKTRDDFETALSRTWRSLTMKFDALHLDIGSMDVSMTREKWVLPLLRQLGYEPVFRRFNTVVDKLEYRISHFGSEDPKAPPIHIIATTEGVDVRDATRRGSKSPQAMLQSYLNQSKAHDWGILTNGVAFRVLRDYYHTTTPGYVQFNLLQMFETRDMDSFRALFRLAHASRFKSRDDNPKWLETYYLTSRAEGTRAEAALRSSVRAAVEVLGNGLLNDHVRGRLADDPARLDEYYQELMRIIYRVIFMLFAEQRHLVPDLNAEHGGLYMSEYSVTALRNLADTPSPLRDTNTDLWERLVQTFRVMTGGCAPLGVPGFDSSLFDPDLTATVVGPTDPAVRLHRPELPRLSNSDVLEFMSHLAYTNASKRGPRERINYRDLAVEEIGHVYEGLLDYAPRVADEMTPLEGENRVIEPGQFFLDPRGMSRKTSGSYYTPRELVQEVIHRSLIPVMEARIEEAGDDPFDQELALLAIRVCDPACGSGAFLIGATNVLAQRLVDIRMEQAVQTGGKTDMDTPQRLYNEAKREVLSHCIYGVDINPMAVELCRVALWINATERGKPLNFLEHRIKCGNSLVGAPPNFYALGIHPDAYKGRGDEDKAVLNEVRKIAAPKEIEEWRNSHHLFDIKLSFTDLSKLKDDTVERVHKIAATYEEQRRAGHRRKLELIADYWTAAFFYPVEGNVKGIPNQEGLTWLVQNSEELSLDQLRSAGRTPVLPQTYGQMVALKTRYKFFHYWLEFPEVFFTDGQLDENAGFDVVLGNPPWERVKLQEQEFFSLVPEVADAPNAAARKKQIAKLEESYPELWAEYQQALVDANALSSFLRVSSRFPLGGSGDINTYTVFVEHDRDLLSQRGRVGMLCPSGIATDDTTKLLFQDLVTGKSLVSLFDFENREKVFRDVDSRTKFSILALAAPGTYNEPSHLSFFNTNIKHLSEGKRRFTLTPEEFALINPNTLTCPTFRTDRDAELTKKLYRKAGVFVAENEGEDGNPWGVKFMAMFHMSSDSELFQTRDQLSSEGFELIGNRFTNGADVYLPLYEAKLAHQFNHRFATYLEDENTRDAELSELQDIAHFSLPRYWVPRSSVNVSLAEQQNYLIAYRRFGPSTNERSIIAHVLPKVGAGDSEFLLWSSKVSSVEQTCLLANLNTLAFDYIARQKIGGTNINYYIVKQLPVLPPSTFTNSTTWTSIIVPKVLELTYTAWDIKPFADDLWREADEALRELLVAQWRENGGHPFSPPEWADITEDGFPHAPFKWDEERRAELRAELDAIYAHLYGLTDEELRWVLDPRDVDSATPSVTFPGLRRKEEAKYGEYRTKRLVLKYFEQWAEKMPQPVSTD